MRRDQVRRGGCARFAWPLTSITNEEVSGNAAHDLSDEDILKVLTREAKKRRRPRAFERPGAPSSGGGARRGDVSPNLPAPRSSTMRSCAGPLAAPSRRRARPGCRDGKFMKASLPRWQAVPRAVASQPRSAVSSAQPDFPEIAEINSAED